MKKRYNFIWILLLLITLSSFGCEEDTKIDLDGNNPPKFKLRGSGKVYFIRVLKSPAPESEVIKNEGGIWQINPDENTRRKTISWYPEIKYGEAPSGFIQKVPRDSAAPPKLEEGQEYILLAPTYNANFETLVFKIKDGKSVIVQKSR